MTKHTLFVCKSCRRSSEELSENQPCDGSLFLDKITTLYNKKFAAAELEIQPVGCLWACNRGCVVALSNQDKPTYLLGDLPPDEENASALLEFIEMYISHRKGAVNWDKLPIQLDSAFLGCIPSVMSQEIPES